MAANELVLRIPHALGATEAQRRIAGVIASANARYGQYLHVDATEWSANRLNFRVSALGQAVRGSIDVQEEFVELKTELPLVIRLLAGRFLPVIENTGQKLLK